MLLLVFLQLAKTAVAADMVELSSRDWPVSCSFLLLVQRVVAKGANATSSSLPERKPQDEENLLLRRLVQLMATDEGEVPR